MAEEDRQRRHPWRMLRTLVVYGVLILVVATAISAWQLRDAPSGAAPAIQGQTPEGEALSLADYRGAPVLVYFWATWCAICKLEAPTINATARRHNVLTVASWSGGTDEVASHVDEAGFTPPVIVDAGGKMAEAYGIKAVPAIFIVDGRGEIRFATSGYTPGIGLRLRLWWVRLSGS